MRSKNSVSKKQQIKQVKYDLLTVNADAKTTKGLMKGYLTGILYLSPATEANGKTNMCGGSSVECVLACLHNEGRARIFKTIKAARIRRTLAYIADFNAFVERIAADIIRLEKHAKSEGLIPVVRLNGTSDQPKLALALAIRFPHIQFYDYTKLNRAWERVRSNYHLTYSFSGTNLTECMEALAHGLNVSVVFEKSLPATWNGYKVINGDESDLRFDDEKGVIVGLKAKGQSSKSVTVGGFIQISGVAA